MAKGNGLKITLDEGCDPYNIAEMFIKTVAVDIEKSAELFKKYSMIFNENSLNIVKQELANLYNDICHQQGRSDFEPLFGNIELEQISDASSEKDEPYLWEGGRDEPWF